jgi:hypothetical protein
LTSGYTHTIGRSVDTHPDTIADAPPAVTQKTNLHEYLVALPYFLRYCSPIPLIEHVNEVIREGVWVDVTMIHALFHNASLSQFFALMIITNQH